MATWVWITIAAAGLYIAVSIAENIVKKRKDKKLKEEASRDVISEVYEGRSEN